MKLKGKLLRDFDGSLFFRYYTKDGKFVDCEILASDITVTIDDPFVKLYTSESDSESAFLDYTEEVLGK